MGRHIVIHNHLPRSRDAAIPNETRVKIIVGTNEGKTGTVLRSDSGFGRSTMLSYNVKLDDGSTSRFIGSQLAKLSGGDAYFNTAERDPYQYVEGEQAARAGKKVTNPYPIGSEASKMWIAGFRSVKKNTGDGFFSDELKGKYTPAILAKADKILAEHQSGRSGEESMLADLKKLGLSRKDIDTIY